MVSSLDHLGRLEKRQFISMSDTATDPTAHADPSPNGVIEVGKQAEA